MDDADVDDSLSPPTARRVAERALILASVACRGAIEKDSGEPEAELLRQRAVAWLDALGILAEAERPELELLTTPLGQCDREQTIVNAVWRSEGMIVLGWALGWLELPHYDQECDPCEAANALGFLAERESTPLLDPVLRSPQQIERGANTYLTLHWRIREYSLHPEPIDFSRFIQSCTWGPLDASELDLEDAELVVRGVRLDRAPAEVLHSVRSIAQERQQAFNWLLGEEPVYSQVTTDT